MLSDLIEQRPSGRAGLAEWYAAIFEAQRSANLPTAEVATATGMSTGNLYYWRRRLRGDEQGLVQIVVEDDPGKETKEPKGPAFEVRLAASRAVLVAPGFDAGELRRLIGALEAC